MRTVGGTMNKLTFLKLWDWYQALLTPTQREITDAYFNQDLTLSEIAEIKGISRQAVSECLSTCKKQLAEYEIKLGLLRTVEEAEAFKQKVAVWAESFLHNHPESAREINSLYCLLNNNDGSGALEKFNKED